MIPATSLVLLKTYIPRADLALYPDEHVDKRRELYYSHKLFYINSNNALDVCDCIMDVLGTKNRLRSDDLVDLIVERFLQNAQIANADGYV
jgi:hypothetical protein